METKDFGMKLMKNPFVINLILLIVVCFVLTFSILAWLDSYTQHGQAVEVPDVKGLTLENAAVFFENSHLKYNVIDSVFSKDVPPGTVVEIIPSPGSKVKEGRILFVTINATTAQMAIIPEVEDLSFRQAYALLKSVGFNRIETEYVPGSYKDLAIAVEMDGKALSPGAHIPLASPLKLIVSSGEAVPDSLDTDDVSRVEELKSEEEKWF